jgi:hypothetical protein
MHLRDLVAEKRRDQGENPRRSPQSSRWRFLLAPKLLAEWLAFTREAASSGTFAKHGNGKKPIRKKHAAENDYPAGLKMIANAKTKFDPLLLDPT